ncbi:MAG: hypothetical protein E6K73_03215 [Candidatus Eisenbacteria bacterium]|uniref:Uncharacterized protein n=1 Tax=Eiseniibacteriota bacterium TaxID=2212470 RepID=A0A538SLN1_UNCEI|nr:MAG: hypothetical protein E6K73_03215 [Candidatus Eisenbacteria bacterium]
MRSRARLGSSNTTARTEPSIEPLFASPTVRFTSPAGAASTIGATMPVTSARKLRRPKMHVQAAFWLHRTLLELRVTPPFGITKPPKLAEARNAARTLAPAGLLTWIVPLAAVVPRASTERLTRPDAR